MGALKKAAALAVLLAACWGAAAGADYRLCTQGKEPVFARMDNDVICIGCYRGLGYTITLHYDGYGQKSNFYWGWGYP